jgi:hypothetical protein
MVWTTEVLRNGQRRLYSAPHPFKPVSLQQIVTRIPHELHRQPSRHIEVLIPLAGVHRHLEHVHLPRGRAVLQVKSRREPPKVEPLSNGQRLRVL